MPSADAILLTATVAANRWWPLAVTWHVVLAVMLFAVWRGWRPARRVAGFLFLPPLLTVSGLAWHSGNPFNAVVFATLAGWLGWQATRLGKHPVSIGSPPTLVLAVSLLAFAWAYPHFLGPPSWVYLVAAPLGLIPCPTLSALIGLVLLFDTFGSRVWGITVGIAGVTYGLIGVFALGVVVDVVLLIGALGLLRIASTRGAGHLVRPHTRWKVAT